MMKTAMENSLHGPMYFQNPANLLQNGPLSEIPTPKRTVGARAIDVEGVQNFGRIQLCTWWAKKMASQAI